MDEDYTIELPDYVVHSDEHPFCFDPTCPDKEDPDNVNKVNDWYQDGLVSREDADNIYHGKTV
jgi:hypothetical protein